MNAQQLQQAIDAMETTIRNGLAWDNSSGHNVYRFSAQYKSDKASVKAMRNRLASMSQPAPRMAVAAGVWDGRSRL